MSAFGRIEGYAQLAGRVNGVGFEVEGSTMEAMPSGLGGVGGPGAEVVECQLGHGEDVVPLVGGGSDMSGREGREEVIFLPCGRSVPHGWCGGCQGERTGYPRGGTVF